MRLMTRPTSLRDQRGFSMFLVIMAMFVTSMFVAAAFAAANGDLPLSGASKDRKATYAAAEAGLNFYLTHLNQDNDYWTKCEFVPPPNATEPNPVNTVWTSGPDLRRWRNVTGSNARYTLEILPANGFTKCDKTNQASVLDLSTGSFRVRATGQPAAGSTQRRSINATFRRHGFLDFLWFTYYEDSDPQSLSTQAQRDYAVANCANKFRPLRGSSCSEIQWVSGDRNRGPLHTNDSLLICGTPTFGRDAGDKIEIGRPLGTDIVADDAPCTNGAIVKGVKKASAAIIEPPSSNTQLKSVATSGTGLYKGRTVIRLLSDNTMVVNNKGVTSTVGVPANGVIYVDSDPLQGTCSPIQYPASTNYTEDAGCGNVYISGDYATSLTIAAANDIIIAPTTNTGTIDWTSANEDITGSNNAVLGLIANNFVRVGHKVDRTVSPCKNVATGFDGRGLTIQAAILSLQHSFINDNYNCGNALGDLHVTGAIAQRYRGPVGTNGGATGFIKDYLYDDRLRYRSPPFFLNPVDSAWSIVRSNEQVPAR
jgi:Tfp pilus assembly protein PilX